MVAIALPRPCKLFTQLLHTSTLRTVTQCEFWSRVALSPGSPSFTQLLRMTFDPMEKCRGIYILARERRLGGHHFTQSGRRLTLKDTPETARMPVRVDMEHLDLHREVPCWDRQP